MKNIPDQRFTDSRKKYWQRLFNDYAQYSEDHEISGWSYQGLHQRVCAYLHIIRELGLPEKALVLDLGCGSGVYTRILSKIGYRVVGMDYAWRVAAEGKKRSDGTNITYLSGDIHNLPFKDSIFNHILCIGLFQSLTEHLIALWEIKRVLNPQGSFCIITLNRLELRHIVRKILRREEPIFVKGKEMPRLITYNPSVFTNHLKTMGFHKVNISPVQIIPEFLSRFSKLIYIWNKIPFFRYLTARSFSVTGQKGHIPATNRG